MVESIQNRIYQRLNLSIVAKSKKVKVKSQRKSKTQLSGGLYQTKVPHASRIPGSAPAHMGTYMRGQAESW